VPISRDLLADDEEVLVDLRLHWVFLFGPLVLTLVALAVAIAVAVDFPSAPAAVAWVLAVMVVIPALWLAGRLTRWFGISLIVTTQRLILRRGVLGRDMVQLRLQRITEVHSTQTPLERILGAGRLIVEVQGENQAVVVDDVRRPKNLQRVLAGRLDDFDRPEDDPTPPRGVEIPVSQRLPERPEPARASSRGSESVADQLIQLDDLRRRGIVTQQEFETKKKELLERL
jgi:membrane protein YdbS with pleckstrin-like domain